MRIHKRRASDGFKNVNMEALFAERFKPIAKSLKTLMVLYKENPAVDAPILRNRLHYSCIWEKFSLLGLEDMDLHKERDRGEYLQDVIEKMNKKVPLEESIAKIEKGSDDTGSIGKNNKLKPRKRHSSSQHVVK